MPMYVIPGDGLQLIFKHVYTKSIVFVGYFVTLGLIICDALHL